MTYQQNENGTNSYEAWLLLLLLSCYVVSDSVWSQRWQLTRLPHPWDSPGKNTGVGCHFLLQSMKVKSGSEVTQSCLTLSDSIDYSLPGSSVHGIFQARVMEWGAIAFSDEAWQLPLLSWNQPPLYKVLDQDYWIMRNNTERDSCEGELKYPEMWGKFLELLILAQAAKRVSEWKTSTNTNGV